MNDTTQGAKHYPANWLIAQDYNPNDHLMNLKGKDYLNVQNRLIWFIRDQRALIAQGLATTSYIVRNDLVELDREAGWAHFKTYVRDVLGNEATMYGSESVRDFPDYSEKAATKSLGRALLALGYGAGSAPELDEGERIVDSPISRPNVTRPRSSNGTDGQAVREPIRREPAAGASAAPSGSGVEREQPATEQQLVSIRKLSVALGKPEPDSTLTFAQARQAIAQLSGEYQRARKAS
jgi:hypothetical protein